MLAQTQMPGPPGERSVMSSSHSNKQQTKTQTLPAFTDGAICLESQLTASTRVPTVSPLDDCRRTTHTYYTQRQTHRHTHTTHTLHTKTHRDTYMHATNRITCYNHAHTIICTSSYVTHITYIQCTYYICLPIHHISTYTHYIYTPLIHNRPIYHMLPLIQYTYTPTQPPHILHTHSTYHMHATHSTLCRSSEGSLPAWPTGFGGQYI